MRSERSPCGGASNVVGIVFLVALTFVLGGLILTTAYMFEMPTDVDDAIPQTGTSPLSPERVGGSFTGDADEVALYDTSSGKMLDGSPNDTAGTPPPSVDDAVSEKVSSLKGSSPPDDPLFTDVRIESGSYYVDSDVSWWGFSNETVTFDTSDGPIRIAVADSGRISADGVDIEVEGGGTVSIYLERSTIGTSDFYVNDAEFDSTTDDFRIFAESEPSGSYDDVVIENSEFRGIVYTPGSTVSIEDSEFYGASVARETNLDGSSYYHDVTLERLGDDILP